MMIDKKQKTLKKKSPKKILPNGVPKKETLPPILKIIPKKEENFPKKGIVFPKKKFQKISPKIINQFFQTKSN